MVDTLGWLIGMCPFSKAWSSKRAQRVFCYFLTSVFICLIPLLFLPVGGSGGEEPAAGVDSINIHNRALNVRGRNPMPLLDHQRDKET